MSNLHETIQDAVISQIKTPEAKIPRELIEVATRTPGFHASFDYGGVHVLIINKYSSTATLVFLEHTRSPTDSNFQDLTVGWVREFNSIKDGVASYQSAIWHTEFESMVEYEEERRAAS